MTVTVQLLQPAVGIATVVTRPQQHQQAEPVQVRQHRRQQQQLQLGTGSVYGTGRRRSGSENVNVTGSANANANVTENASVNVNANASASVNVSVRKTVRKTERDWAVEQVRRAGHHSLDPRPLEMRHGIATGTHVALDVTPAESG